VVSNHGPSVCRTDALPLSYRGLVADVRLERRLQIMSLVWFQLHHVRSAAERTRTPSVLGKSQEPVQSGADGMLSPAPDSNGDPSR
jgi:hypothetical protein